MTATVNTDASYHPPTRKGSFAYWIAMNGERYLGPGLLQGIITDSVEAELKAIANALHQLVYSIRPEKLDVIYLNTDSKPAIILLESGKKCSRNGKYKQELAYIRRATKGITLHLRHVRAHTHTNTQRNYVNDWCDKQCREAITQYKNTLNLDQCNNSPLLSPSTDMTTYKLNVPVKSLSMLNILKASS